MIELVKKPNGIALTVYGILLGLALICFFLLRFIVRRLKRRRKSKVR